MAFKIYSNYGWTKYDPADLKQHIDKCIRVLTQLKQTLKFDTIAFMGSSGAPLAYPASMALNVPVMYVRKENEQSHGRPIESNCHNNDIRRYIIVDDFTETGATVNKIYKIVCARSRAQGQRAPVLTGIFLYDATRPGGSISVGRRRVPVYTTVEKHD